jgi:ParB-like chromosome segregation protein Spo0J
MAALAKVRDLIPHQLLGGDEYLPGLDEDQYAALKESIASVGIMQALVVARPEMVILDGHHRWRIAKELGLEEVPVRWEETLPAAKQFWLGLEINLARRHLNVEQRRAVARVILLHQPFHSDRLVAKTVGLSHTTVASVRADMVATGQIVQSEDRVGSDGVKRKKPRPTGSRKDKRPKHEKPADAASAVVAAAEARKQVSPSTPRGVRRENDVLPEGLDGRVDGGSSGEARISGESAPPASSDAPSTDGEHGAHQDEARAGRGASKPPSSGVKEGTGQCKDSSSRPDPREGKGEDSPRGASPSTGPDASNQGVFEDRGVLAPASGPAPDIHDHAAAVWALVDTLAETSEAPETLAHAIASTVTLDHARLRYTVLVLEALLREIEG